MGTLYGADIGKDAYAEFPAQSQYGMLVEWEHTIRVLKRHRRLLVFGAAGVMNTVVDFVLFLLLHAMGVPIFLANLCSTSAAIAVSLLLNSRFVFRGRPITAVLVVQFLAVTITGAWLLQPLVIAGMSVVMANLFSVTSGTVWAAMVKTGATVASLCWNYVWYSRVVFAGKRAQPDASE